MLVLMKHCRERIPIELHSSDVQEDKIISDFMLAGCGCKKGYGGKPCLSEFSVQYIVSVRQSCAELTRNEFDLVVMVRLCQHEPRCDYTLQVSVLSQVDPSFTKESLCV